jgi:hypothetical protein
LKFGNLKVDSSYEALFAVPGVPKKGQGELDLVVK